MAKRKVKRPVETIIIVVVLSLLAIATALYVYLTFRATIVKNTLNKETDRYYSVLYVDYDDTLLISDCYGEGLIRKTPPTPTREDHDFLGWSLNNSLKVYSTAETYNMTIDRDVIFKAVYQERQLTVNYLDSDMTLIQSIIYKSSETMPTIQNPTKEGYIFTGWDTVKNGDITTCVAMFLENTSNYVCRVNNRYYSSINEAVNAFNTATGEDDASIDIHIWDDFYVTSSIKITSQYLNKTIKLKLESDVCITGYVENGVLLFSDIPFYIDTGVYNLILDNKNFSIAWENHYYAYLRGNLELKQKYYAPTGDEVDTIVRSRLNIESGSRLCGEVHLEYNGLNQLVFKGNINETNNIILHIRGALQEGSSSGVEYVKGKYYILSSQKIPKSIISKVTVAFLQNKYEVSLIEKLVGQSYRYYLDLSSIEG